MGSRRKWSCPSENMIAGYGDGTLRKWKAAWIEFHLANCQECRLAIADLVKAQREADLSMPSAELVRRARGSAGPPSYAPRWAWTVAGVLAAMVLLAVLTTMLVHKPEQLALTPPASPAPPMIARSEPVPAPRTVVREHEAVRGPQSLQWLPTLLSPQPGTLSPTATPEFSWRPVPNSRSYKVRVVPTDGEPVWEGETEKSALRVPSAASLSDGAYFVWITAVLNNGQLAKAPPVRFQVKR